jgi:hypothetical protein
MRRASAVVIAFGIAACGGQTSSGTGPGGAGDTSAEASVDTGASPGDDGGPTEHTTFLTLLRATGCLPQALPEAAGRVPCTVFEVLSGGGCEAAFGLAPVDPAVASKVLGAAQASATETVCMLDQIVTAPGTSCATSPSPGWCYVTGAAAGQCPQDIAFTPGEPEPGAIVVLGCQ